MSFHQTQESDDSIERLHWDVEQSMHQVQSAGNSDIEPDHIRGTILYAEKLDTEVSNPGQHKAMGSPFRWGFKHNSPFLNTKFHFFIALLSTAIFALILWFVQVFSASTAIRTGQAMNRILKFDIGSALAVLRVTQGFLSTVTTIGLMKSLEMIHWGLAGRAHGLGSGVFLGLSPTTPLTEVIRIVISRASDWMARIWGLIRLTLVAAIWVAAILLFVKTSTVTAYDSVTEYSVTAGVGLFNGSYIPRSIQKLKDMTPEYPFQIVPSNAISTVYSLVGNSIYVTNTPSEDCETCDSYLLTGGVIMVTPWLPNGYDGYPLISIEKLPATQIQFQNSIEETDGFRNSDCDVFGRKSFLIGIKMCVAESKANPGSMIAGLYVCTNGTDHGDCESSIPRPNITTTISVYNRTVSIVASRMNYSILAVTEYGKADQISSTDVTSFRAGLAWFLDFNASATPPPSSFAEPFWSGQDLLQDAAASSELKKLLQSMLAFPLWYFQPNNYGNPDLQVKEMINSLPREFYTKAQITRPYTRITINDEMFITFVVLHSLVLAFIWGVLLWLWIWKPSLPKLSSYPLIDFAFKSKELATSGDDSSPSGQYLIEADDMKIRHRFRETRIALRKARDSGTSTESI